MVGGDQSEYAIDFCSIHVLKVEIKIKRCTCSQTVTKPYQSKI